MVEVRTPWIARVKDMAERPEQRTSIRSAGILLVDKMMRVFAIVFTALVANSFVPGVRLHCVSCLQERCELQGCD